MTIIPIPMEYGGIKFRSTLEASWACTMDAWEWRWSYEPIALCIDGENYLPDFYVASQNLWLEVKGPDNERMHKPARLDQDIADDELDVHKPLVVVLRPPGRGDSAVWEGIRADMDVVLSTCPECEHQTFIDLEGIWICRQCWTGQRLKDHSRDWVTHYSRSGETAFWRAPRAPRAAA